MSVQSIFSNVGVEMLKIGTNMPCMTISQKIKWFLKIHFFISLFLKGPKMSKFATENSVQSDLFQNICRGQKAENWYKCALYNHLTKNLTLFENSLFYLLRGPKLSKFATENVFPEQFLGIYRGQKAENRCKYALYDHLSKN